MGKGWPNVKLGEVLSQVRREETVQPDREYAVLGAHWYAHGLYTKEIKPGSSIKAAKAYRVEEGDFVYNRLFAWKGSFAVASDANAGCYVSNEFPCFDVARDRLEPRFLWHYFRREAAWNESLGLSHGATPTSRNRLKEAKLLAMQIPLPPLSEQRRIVAKIDRLAEKIEEARGLHSSITQSCDATLRSMIFTSAHGWPRMPMHQIVRLREPHVEVRATETYEFAGVYCFGRGVFRGDRKTGLETSYKRLTRLNAGDFVYPKLMAWEGALATVPPPYEGLVVSPEFPVFEPNHDFILPETLDVYFRSPAVWGRLGEISTGTNVRRRRLQPKDFLRYEMVVPPMSAQERLRAVKAKVDAIKKLQEQTAAELDALLPSILDRAFKGEL